MDSGIWTHVTVKVPRAMEDPLADFLTTLTGRGVCLREEAGLSIIDAYIKPGEAEDHLLRLEKHLEDLVRMGMLPEGTRFELEDLPEEDWMAVFRSQHTAIRVSDRLVIRPTWCEPAWENEIVLDPGMAFGTGGHATTRMCLALLDQSIGTPPPRTMFDLGTGSGILAIAGAHLGIPSVLAADIDTVAVQISAQNVLDNHLEDRIRVVEGGVTAAEGLYDLITANLSASLLKRLSSDITGCLAPEGKLIISGILESETQAVLEAFRRCGLEAGEVLQEKGWAAGLLQRPG